MLQHLIHTSILLTVFYLFYWLFISKETFFQLNRYILVGTLLLSAGLPFLQIPSEWSIREKIEYQILPDAPIQEAPEQEAVVTIDSPTVAQETKLEKITETSTAISPLQVQRKSNLNILKILTIIYWVGTGIFFLAFLIQFFVLLAKRLTLNHVKDGKFRIVELVKDEAPYSFWNSIFINPAKYDVDTYDQIIKHEKVHINDKHFVDKILSELAVIFFWYNPFVWLYRKAVTDNLEYLTDARMLEAGTNAESYQLSLLQVSVPQQALHLTTNYNQSILKKRITMMNSKKSSARSAWKYLFIIPLLGVSIVTLSAIQEDTNLDYTKQRIEQDIQEAEITTVPEVTSDNLQEPSDTAVKKNPSLHLINETPEHTSNQPKSVTENPQITSKQITDPKEITIDDWSNVKPGMWIGEIKGNEVCLQMHYRKGNSHSMSTHCFDKSEFSSIPTTDDSFIVKREAGTLHLEGSFKGNDGSGSFSFKANDDFSNYLESQGLDVDEEREMYYLFMNNTTKNYVSYLKSKFRGLDGDDLVAMSVHNLDKQLIIGYTDACEKVGITSVDIDDMISMKIHNVRPHFIQEIGAIDKNANVDDIVSAKIHNVDPEFVQTLEKSNIDNISLEDLVAMSIHNVDADYITEMYDLGFKNLDVDDLVSASIHNVSSRLVKSLRDHGYNNLDMDDIIQMSIHDVDSRYIKELADAGYKDLSVDEIVSSAIHDVDISLLKQFDSNDDIEMQDLINMSIHDVDPEYIEELRGAGLSDLTSEELTRLSIHDISAEDVIALKKSNIRGVTFDNIVSAGIHDVDPDIIRVLKETGYTDIEMDDVISLAIHGVSEKDIRGLHDMSISNTSVQTLIESGIHGVNPSFIKRAKERGYNLKTLKEYIKIGIHGF